MKKILWCTVLITNLIYYPAEGILAELIFKLSAVKCVNMNYNVRFLSTMTYVSSSKAKSNVHLIDQEKRPSYIKRSQISGMLDQYSQDVAAYVITRLIIEANKCGNADSQERIPFEIKKYMVDNASVIKIILENLDKNIAAYGVESSKHKKMLLSDTLYEREREELIEARNELNQFEISLIGLQHCFEVP